MNGYSTAVAVIRRQEAAGGGRREAGMTCHVTYSSRRSKRATTGRWSLVRMSRSDSYLHARTRQQGKSEPNYGCERLCNYRLSLSVSGCLLLNSTRSVQLGVRALAEVSYLIS